jgi:hypothetical protein
MHRRPIPELGGTLPDTKCFTLNTEYRMGSKPSNNFQSDRPESGGADKDMEREKSGLLDLDREKFAIEHQARREAAHREHTVLHTPRFSIDSPPNSDPNKDKR